MSSIGLSFIRGGGMRHLLFGLFFRRRHTTVMAMIAMGSIMHTVAIVVTMASTHGVLLSAGTICITLVLKPSRKRGKYN